MALTTEIEGRRYLAVVGSDVIRDGMYLEVHDDADEAVLEVFHDDAHGRMRLSAFADALPVPLVEWAIGRARERLVPERQEDDTA